MTSPADALVSQCSPLWLVLNGKSADDEGVREAVATLRARGTAVSVRVT